MTPVSSQPGTDQDAASEIDEGVYVAVCGALVEVGVNPDDAEEDTPFFLSALAEAGYTVVKTEDARRWLLDYAYSPDDVVFGERGLTDDQLPALHELLDIVLPDWRLSWEPVPEGGEQ